MVWKNWLKNKLSESQEFLKVRKIYGPEKSLNFHTVRIGLCSHNHDLTSSRRLLWSDEHAHYVFSKSATCKVSNHETPKSAYHSGKIGFLAKAYLVFEVLYFQFSQGHQLHLIWFLNWIPNTATSWKKLFFTSKVSKMIIWKFNILEFKRGVKQIGSSQRTKLF